MIRPDLIIRTVNGDAMRMKFFFFFSCDEKGKRGEGGRGGYYFFGCENFLIIIDEKSRSPCFWDLINAEIWRKIRKKNFLQFYTSYLFFFFLETRNGSVIILKVWANYMVGRIIGKFGNYR